MPAHIYGWLLVLYPKNFAWLFQKYKCSGDVAGRGKLGNLWCGGGGWLCRNQWNVQKERNSNTWAKKKKIVFRRDGRHFRVPTLTFVLHLPSNLWRRNARDRNFKRIFSSNFLMVWLLFSHNSRVRTPLGLFQVEFSFSLSSRILSELACKIHGICYDHFLQVKYCQLKVIFIFNM